MYHLNQFCNIITALRKERGWTQTNLADRIGIAPQSVSKWECGVGYPDITLFPVIADLFGVPIGVLFGEGLDRTKENETMKENLQQERSYVYDPLQTIDFSINSCCRIRVIDGVRENATVTVQGDSTFMEYVLVEKDDGRLRVTVKNPSGSAFHWEPYDRGGYEGENVITVYSGVEDSDCYSMNMLDLVMSQWKTEAGYDEWLICTMEEAKRLFPSEKAWLEENKEALSAFRITQPMK